jgi:transposase
MRRATQGAWSNYTNLRVQPADHAIGRSRGGLSRKIHQLVDGAGLPLVVLVTRGQAGDSPMFEPWQPRRQAARLRRRRHKDRNVVERGFNNTKQWRGTATGYDLLGV